MLLSLKTNVFVASLKIYISFHACTPRYCVTSLETIQIFNLFKIELNVKINFSWNSISGNFLYHIKLFVIIWAKHVTNFLYLCIIIKSHKFYPTTINFQNKFFGSITCCFDISHKWNNHFVVVFFSSFWEVFN